MTISKVLDYINQNKINFENQLVEFLKIPSISAQQKHQDDTKRAARFMADEFKRIGLKNIEVVNYKDAYPIIYADLITDPAKPTVLCYGHYDVQPVDPLDKWESDPFKPVIKNNYIYARGADDNKGQFFTHIKAVDSYLRAVGTLPVNIKFVVEGDEESSKSVIEEYVAANATKLKADVVLISDTDMFAHGLPTITYALRGLVGFEIHVDVAKTDLHSGQYGGTVANPAIVLSQMISKLVDDKTGKILVPGVYDDVIPLTEEEKAGFAKLPFVEANYLKETGAPKVFGEDGFSTLERMWARPTMDVNGICGGYIEEGVKTVLPGKAFTKITMRLVANQHPHKVAEQFKDYIKKITPSYARVEVIQVKVEAFPAYTPVNNKYNKAAAAALKHAFDRDAVFIRSGGALPVVTAFQNSLGAAVVLAGFGDSDDNIHGPNEHLNLDNFHKGIKTVVYFLSGLN